MITNNCPTCGKRIKSQRSNSQNNYYWGHIIQTLSNELGYMPDEIHEIMKAKFLKQSVTLVDGQEVIYSRSTASLKTDEFISYNAMIRIWAAKELGIQLLEPGEI